MFFGDFQDNTTVEPDYPTTTTTTDDDDHSSGTHDIDSVSDPDLLLEEDIFFDALEPSPLITYHHGHEFFDSVSNFSSIPTLVCSCSDLFL
jgi:hypothetical protein